MVRIEDLYVSFGNEKVISNLSFELSKGEKVAVVGASGSGKTTLLNVLMGFVKPSRGVVTVDGVRVSASTIDSIRRGISWLPQELHLKLDTVRELLFYPFGFKQNRMMQPSDREVEEMLSALLLDNSILDKQLCDISGGQKQRIVIASLILLKRPLLLLDEPTSALDSVSKRAVVDAILGLKHVTVLASSHDSEWNDAMERIVDLNSK
jgi:ABC-type multidrug transport system ATPase subunit